MGFNASRNPYEHAELFCMLERLRRNDELDAKSDNELGELLMSVAKYSYTCYVRSGKQVKEAPCEAESEMLMYIIEVSRKADTSDPKAFVNCLIKSGQNRLRSMLRDRIKHNNVIYPTMDEDAVETACAIDGTPESDIFENIKLYSKKEPANG